MGETLGKKAEHKIAEWLNRPEDGYSLDRLYDQMTGFYMVSRNICDYICYKYPYIYYIECKETEKDRFDFDMIQPHQHDGLLKKSKIPGCFGLVTVLFTTYKRTFILKIQDIVELENRGKKSINIQKIDKWTIPYKEIQTVPSRKELLDYTGNIEDLI